MHKHHHGFTIIEVSLFLALSGILMVGLIASANSSISRQRYNDSVNDVADYFRGVYSGAINVSNNSSGDKGFSNEAVYGKLIILSPDTSNYSKIDTYTIVGGAVSSANIPPGNIISVLSSSSVHANIRNSSSGNFYEQESHIFPWGTTLENTSGNTAATGAILILRSPTSGTIYTYYNSTVNLNNFPAMLSSSSNTGDINICIDSPDNNYGRRRNLRIRANASGSSGVELVAQDDMTDNMCGDGNSGNTP